ncbi:MAG: hypothetical protein AAF495_03155 [Pseudomonadota bacterium]
MDEDYSQRRRDVEAVFKRSVRDRQKTKRSVSLSGKFELTIDTYSTGENTWEFTRGIVRRAGSGKTIADVKRNYSNFWHSWVQHANGNEYLLCGEDYQGQTVVNLTKGDTYTYFPKAGHGGFGFCWLAAFPSPDSTVIAVDGCYWACPYEIVFFDFTTPDDLPYREYLRLGDLADSDGWLNNDAFKFTQEIEVRKSDGRPYEELSEAEQDQLDSNEESGEYVERDVIVTREQILRSGG